MENSILISIKKILGIDATYTAFDLDIIVHINSAFSSLSQFGIGPTVGYTIEDNTAGWSDLALPQKQLGMVKTYIYLKTRMAFDPPTTHFLIFAMEKQIAEHEWRLMMSAEEFIPAPVRPPREVDTIYVQYQGYP